MYCALYCAPLCNGKQYTAGQGAVTQSRRLTSLLQMILCFLEHSTATISKLMMFSCFVGSTLCTLENASFRSFLLGYIKVESCLFTLSKSLTSLFYNDHCLSVMNF